MTMTMTTMTTTFAAAEVAALEARVRACRGEGKQPGGSLKRALRDARERAAFEAATAPPPPAEPAEATFPEPTLEAIEAVVETLKDDEAWARADGRQDDAREIGTRIAEAERAGHARRRRTATAEAQAAAAPATPTAAPKQRGKLTDEQAAEIMRRATAGEKRKALAAEFGIHVSSISDLFSRRYHKAAAA
jgi:hypothetical protein